MKNASTKSNGSPNSCRDSTDSSNWRSIATNSPWAQQGTVLQRRATRLQRVILMFKMLVLQSLYNLSDKQTELQIRDRLSFMKFLDMTFADVVPYATKLRLFREYLKALELKHPLFERFNKELKGYLEKR